VERLTFCRYEYQADILLVLDKTQQVDACRSNGERNFMLFAASTM
jgi:hypothetical protein